MADTTPRQEETAPPAIGDRVQRIDPSSRLRRVGTVIELGNRPARACETQAQKVELRIRVRWDGDPSDKTHPSCRDGQTSWLAVSAEGKRWKRLPPDPARPAAPPEPPRRPIEVGDRIVRLEGFGKQTGRINNIFEGRKRGRKELRINVVWDRPPPGSTRETSLALSAEGKRWKRIDARDLRELDARAKNHHFGRLQGDDR